MKIIIPMAGQGVRFLKAGYTEPKPLIKVNGKLMIEHVANLFPDEDDFIFICNEYHLKTTEMHKVLRSVAPKAKIVAIAEHKKGPVYTVVQISQFIDDREPLIINYCDFFMDWDYFDFKKTVLENHCDGCVPAYKGFHPHLIYEQNLYASMRVDENNYMLEIREKHSFTPNKMDSHQSPGIYYFSKGQYVKKYFNELMEKDLAVNGEYYVSLVYNLLKQDGLSIYVYDKILHFLQWGTPEDLEEYKYWSEIFQNK